MERQLRNNAALRSLDGLSVGDAFGECFFSISLNEYSLQMHLSTRTLPNWRWTWTDDTAMAISLVEHLVRYETVQQDELAAAFAKRYTLEDNRGYGGTAHGILRAIHGGADWRIVAPRVLSGQGSMGNGGAMRVAPLGAYFADEPAKVIGEASKSAEVTHAHPEGQAGAIAVALAAAFMTSVQSGEFIRDRFFEFVIDQLPDSETRARVLQAHDLPSEFAVSTVSSVLGDGSKLTSPDTVPFCLWCAAKFPADFESAMWTAVSAGGDIDTNCAIIGGIIAAGNDGAPPPSWIARREPLPQI
jgi:ADP-ribosylglycohydrolase